MSASTSNKGKSKKFARKLQWDEENLVETSIGRGTRQKINEPKTPYVHSSEFLEAGQMEEADIGQSMLASADIEERISERLARHVKTDEHTFANSHRQSHKLQDDRSLSPKSLRGWDSSSTGTHRDSQMDEDDDDQDDELIRRLDIKPFERKRASHYGNMREALKMGKRLLDDDDANSESDGESRSVEPTDAGYMVEDDGGSASSIAPSPHISNSNLASSSGASTLKSALKQHQLPSMKLQISPGDNVLFLPKTPAASEFGITVMTPSADADDEADHLGFRQIIDLFIDMSGTPRKSRRTLSSSNPARMMTSENSLPNIVTTQATPLRKTSQIDLNQSQNSIVISPVTRALKQESSLMRPANSMPVLPAENNDDDDDDDAPLFKGETLPMSKKVLDSTVGKYQEHLAYISTLYQIFRSKEYYSGWTYKLNDLQPDGQQAKNRTWTLCYTYIIGTEFVFWRAGDADKLQESCELGQDVNLSERDTTNFCDGSIEWIGVFQKIREKKITRSGIFAVNSAGANRFFIQPLTNPGDQRPDVVQDPTIFALKKWVAATRIALFEETMLSQMYSEVLLRRDDLHAIEQQMFYRDGKIDIFKCAGGRAEGWLQLRIAGNTQWQRHYCIAERLPTAAQLNAKKSDDIAKMPPMGRGQLLVFLDKKDADKHKRRHSRSLKKEVGNPLKHAVFQLYDVGAANAIFPENAALINMSTIFKIQDGSILLGDKAPKNFLRATPPNTFDWGKNIDANASKQPNSGFISPNFMIAMADSQKEMISWLLGLWCVFDLNNRGFEASVRTRGAGADEDRSSYKFIKECISLRENHLLFLDVNDAIDLDMRSRDMKHYRESFFAIAHEKCQERQLMEDINGKHEESVSIVKSPSVRDLPSAITVPSPTASSFRVTAKEASAQAVNLRKPHSNKEERPVSSDDNLLKPDTIAKRPTSITSASDITSTLSHVISSTHAAVEVESETSPESRTSQTSQTSQTSHVSSIAKPESRNPVASIHSSNVSISPIKSSVKSSIKKKRRGKKNKQKDADELVDIDERKEEPKPEKEKSKRSARIVKGRVPLRKTLKESDSSSEQRSDFEESEKPAARNVTRKTVSSTVQEVSLIEKHKAELDAARAQLEKEKDELIAQMEDMRLRLSYQSSEIQSAVGVTPSIVSYVPVSGGSAAYRPGNRAGYQMQQSPIHQPPIRYLPQQQRVAPQLVQQSLVPAPQYIPQQSMQPQAMQYPPVPVQQPLQPQNVIYMPETVPQQVQYQIPPQQQQQQYSQVGMQQVQYLEQPQQQQMQMRYQANTSPTPSESASVINERYNNQYPPLQPQQYQRPQVYENMPIEEEEPSGGLINIIAERSKNRSASYNPHLGVMQARVEGGSTQRKPAGSNNSSNSRRHNSNRRHGGGGGSGSVVDFRPHHQQQQQQYPQRQVQSRGGSVVSYQGNGSIVNNQRPFRPVSTINNNQQPQTIRVMDSAGNMYDIDATQYYQPQ